MISAESPGYAIYADMLTTYLRSLRLLRVSCFNAIFEHCASWQLTQYCVCFVFLDICGMQAFVIAVFYCRPTLPPRPYPARKKATCRRNREMIDVCVGRASCRSRCERSQLIQRVSLGRRIRRERCLNVWNDCHIHSGRSCANCLYSNVLHPLSG